MQKEPDVKGAVLTKKGYQGGFQGSDVLADYMGEYYSSSYFMDAERWAEIERKFDKSLPPQELTRTLQAGESIEFETKICF
ncbi:MAG: hypothetical protein IPK01_00040 [Acidobacteria bacterium]|nr:hypothetical protein [Acidobacteriota bacterium]